MRKTWFQQESSRFLWRNLLHFPISVCRVVTDGTLDTAVSTVHVASDVTIVPAVSRCEACLEGLTKLTTTDWIIVNCAPVRYSRYMQSSAGCRCRVARLTSHICRCWIQTIVTVVCRYYSRYCRYSRYLHQTAARLRKPGDNCIIKWTKYKMMHSFVSIL